MVKRIIVLLIVMINLCGCTFLTGKKGDKINEKDTRPIMLKHLSEKYGDLDYEEISYKEKYDPVFLEEGCEHDTLELEVLINDKKRTVVVERRENNDGYECYDNYFEYIVEEEMDDYIKKMAEKYFDIIKISSGFMWDSFFPNSLTNNSNFDDLLAADKTEYEVFIHIYSDVGEQTIDEFENNVNEFIKEYEKLGIITEIEIYGCKNQVFDDTQDAEINEENIKYTYENTVNDENNKK